MSTIPGIPYGPAPKAAQYARALTQWDLIVIHDTGHHGAGGSIASAAGEAHYAATRDDPRERWTSCHAYIDTGGPVGSLSLDLQAWAAFSWANSRGVHLEMCGENAGEVANVPAVTVAHTARLVRQIAALKGIPLVKLTPAQLGAAARNGTRVRGVCGHYDITLGLGVGDHSDPGPGFDWSAFMAQVNGAAPMRGDDMPLEGMDRAQVNNSERYLQAIYFLSDHAVGISDTVHSNDVPSPFTAKFLQLAADVAELKARPAATVALAPGDLDALAVAVAAKLGHVPTAAEVADAVNDDQAARLAQ
jgi:hypothetical protein